MNRLHNAFMVSPIQTFHLGKTRSLPNFGKRARPLGTKEDYFLNASNAYLASDVQWSSIQPGVLYTTFSFGAQWQPTHVYALKVNPKAPGVQIRPVLANAQEMGHRKTLTELADSQPHVLAATNCSYFRVQPLEAPGTIVGHAVLDGKLVSASSMPLATLGIDRHNRIQIARTRLDGHLRLPFRKSIRVDSFNQLPSFRNGYFRFNTEGNSYNEYMEKRGPWNEVIAFDHHWGQQAPPMETGMTQVLITHNRVQAISDTTSFPIPERDGYVIVGPSEQLDILKEKMTAKVDLKLTPRSWANIQYAISGKPLLLQNGRPVDVWKPEGLPNAPQLNKRFAARTAAGVTQDGQLILLTTEGREYEGLNLTDLSQLLKGLGAVDALNLDGGKSSQMRLQNKLVNPRQTEIGLPAALCIFYQK